MAEQMAEKGSTATQVPKVGIFVDAENVGGILKNDGARTLVDIASEFGNPVLRKAYGNWKKLSTAQEQTLVDRGFQLIHTPHAVPKKNAADIAMVIDVIEIQQSMPELDCFVLVSSDSDFFQLFVHLKQAGRKVVGVCSQRSALQKRAQTTCDRFIFLDPKKSDGHEREVQQQLEEQRTLESMNTGQGAFATHKELFDFLRTNTVGKSMRKRMVKLYKAYCREKPWLSSSGFPLNEPSPEFEKFLRHVERIRQSHESHCTVSAARPTKPSAKQLKKKEKQRHLTEQFVALHPELRGHAAGSQSPGVEADLSLLARFRDVYMSKAERRKLEWEAAALRAERAAATDDPAVALRSEGALLGLKAEAEAGEAVETVAWCLSSSSSPQDHAPQAPVLAPPSILLSSPNSALLLAPWSPSLFLHRPFLSPAASASAWEAPLSPFLLNPAPLRLHSLAFSPPATVPSLSSSFLDAHPSLRFRTPSACAPSAPLSSMLAQHARTATRCLSSGGQSLRRAVGGGAAGFLLACSFTVAAAEGSFGMEKEGRHVGIPRRGACSGDVSE